VNAVSDNVLQAGNVIAMLPPMQIDDTTLVQRIIAAYQASIRTEMGSPGSFWFAALADVKRPIHDALIAGDIPSLQAMLRDPKSTDLFYGFDNLAKSLLGSNAEHASSTHAYAQLLRLCDAIGARRIHNPEQPDKYPDQPNVDALLERLDAKLGVRTDFPNPFDGEGGVRTSRGMASYRAIHALYQAWRITRIFTGESTSPRVVEIGAGMGRTAFYAIIDIPMSAVAQAYFLGRTLGSNSVSLYLEPAGPGIRILPPSEFFDRQDRYDLVLNVDSWTEMAPDTAVRYIRAAEERSSVIWSVNHEVNDFMVRDLFSSKAAQRVVRSPYWMRDGYVDEMLDQRSLTGASSRSR
jgi:hypothetical protein